jgi:hypothetical protein
MQLCVDLKENEMLSDLFIQGNLSNPNLDKLAYPILKFQEDNAAILIISIMNMLLSNQKCSQTWKEGKILMLPRPCIKDEKDKSEN